MSQKYFHLLDKIREIYSLKSAQALLGWDQETMMPSRGGEGRASSTATLSKIIQEKYCDKNMGSLIEDCLTINELTPSEKRNVEEVKKDREKLLKIPISLTEELSKTTSLSQQVWSEARTQNDTDKFNPWLEKVVKLKQQEAECLGYSESPYDAMLNEYEPGATKKDIENILTELEGPTVNLLQKITHSSTQPKDSIFSQIFDVDLQKVFNKEILKDLTFNMDAGRLDESTHPFTEGVWPTDVRLTTRYSETDILSAIFGTIHEGGHGLYEQGFLPDYYGTPMGEAVSLGVHESQSRLWENQVGRSVPFWKKYFQPLKKVYPQQLNDVTLHDFYFALNSVRPSLIRVEADEVSYNLHIILRFQLESLLFSNELIVSELEEAWKEKMKKILGVVPEKPKDGFLQDVHWSLGLFGYFPTYSLGNIYASQFFNKLNEELNPIEEYIEQGKFHDIREWLREKVHQHGRYYSPAELVKEATGEAPNAKYFVMYLEKKYSDLYNIT